MRGEGKGEGPAEDGVVGRREGERDRSAGNGIEDGMDKERAGIEEEMASVGGGECEQGGAMDRVSGEVEVEGERHVLRQRVRGVSAGVRIQSCHLRLSPFSNLCSTAAAAAAAVADRWLKEERRKCSADISTIDRWAPNGPDS